MNGKDKKAPLFSEAEDERNYACYDKQYNGSNNQENCQIKNKSDIVKEFSVP